MTTESVAASTLTTTKPSGRSAILFAIGFAAAATMTAVATLFAVTGAGPIERASGAMVALLCASLFIALVLTVVLGLRIWKLVRSRARHVSGAQMHLRFAALFSLAAVAPAVIVALFLGASLSSGLEQWFSGRMRSVVENGAGVGQAYLREATENVRGEMLAMAQDLNRARTGLTADINAYRQYLTDQASLRNFPAAYVLNRNSARMAIAEMPNSAPFTPPSSQSFDTADRGDVSVAFTQTPDAIRALYRLADYDDAYLYTVRPLESGIVSKLYAFDQSVFDYREIERRRTSLQTLFALSYLSTAWLVLLAAVWLGLANATRIAEPVGALANAARRLASGDLAVRVAAGRERDEVDDLGRAFNAMSEQIEAQRAALMRARIDAEMRSGFTQAVLSGVSAGVIGLDRDGRVNALNESAEKLLGVGKLMGRRLVDVAPEFSELLGVGPGGAVEAVRVDLVRDGVPVHLSVRASAAAGAEGVVLTFDDMTKLIAAQRQEAWKDVARRIAHEIKNPLTPIQLSAERLKRKYGREIHTDPETFVRCTDTILRQVADIGRMVDEFSAFARMPTPRMAEEDLAEIVRASAFAQRIAFPDTRFDVEAPDGPAPLWCDGRLIGQALTNILKNAAEAIQTRRLEGGEPKEGRVLVRLTESDTEARIEVTDNGVGFPVKDRERLFEPYVTSRAKGTGLGLAIVQRVAEDHGGRLELSDPPGGGPGALVRITLSKTIERPEGLPKAERA